jgi:hypothetical protein
MDEPTPPFAIPPGGRDDPEPPQPPLSPRPRPPSSPAGPVDTQPLAVPRSPFLAAAAMPPLGPPYAAPAVPPPPTYPSSPPEEWPSIPPLLPAPGSGPSGTSGGRRPREPGDPGRGALLIAAIGAAAIVIVGVLAWGQSNDDGNERFIAGAPTTTAPVDTDSQSSATDSSSTDPESSDSSSSSSTEPDLQTAVRDIQAFVERERGLTFKSAVDVQLATDDQLTQMLDQQLAKERQSLLESQEVLRALGLIPPTYDLTTAAQDLQENGVLGFYDAETKKLVVRGTQVTPFVREVLAHELTHALDDQWFDLNRPQLDTADDETGFGFTALTEGDAIRVEQAYLATLSAGERAAAIKEQQDILLAHPEIFTMPQVLLDITQEPYTDGPVLVKNILDAGNRERLDVAFQQPPTTSEQVIDPAKFLAGEQAVPVAVPAADGTVLNKGVLGAFMFEEILLGSIRTSDVDEAVAGWAGDEYVTWLDGSGKTCLRDAFVGDTPDDTQQLADALNQWAPDVNATVTAPAGQPGTFTVCS